MGMLTASFQYQTARRATAAALKSASIPQKLDAWMSKTWSVRNTFFFHPIAWKDRSCHNVE
jgi:hypothetical protein